MSYTTLAAAQAEAPASKCPQSRRTQPLLTMHVRSIATLSWFSSTLNTDVCAGLQDSAPLMWQRHCTLWLQNISFTSLYTSGMLSSILLGLGGICFIYLCRVEQASMNECHATQYTCACTFPVRAGKGAAGSCSTGGGSRSCACSPGMSCARWLHLPSLEELAAASASALHTHTSAPQYNITPISPKDRFPPTTQLLSRV